MVLQKQASSQPIGFTYHFWCGLLSVLTYRGKDIPCSRAAYPNYDAVNR